jgi:hypothetical protein
MSRHAVLGCLSSSSPEPRDGARQVSSEATPTSWASMDFPAPSEPRFADRSLCEDLPTESR